MRTLDLLGITLLLLCVAVGYFGFARIRSNTEAVSEWLPDVSEAREDLEFFESRFGSDDFLVITWKDCTIDDPRLELLEQAIRGLDQESKLIQNVLHGQAVMKRMTERYQFSKREVAKRLQGVFFGFTRPSMTCLNVELSQLGASSRRESMKLVRQAISQVEGLPADDVIFGGYPYISTTIDQLLMNSLRYWLVPSVVLATLISFLCLRDLVLMMIVFTTSMSAAIISLALIPLSGVQFGGLMSIIPALVFVLTTSGCVHLIRYGLVVGIEPQKVLAMGWMPCAVSTATTVVGMLSLTWSQFPAIRKFGFFCATGVGVGLLFQLVMVPWLLQRFGARPIAKLAGDHQRESRFWRAWYRAIRKHCWSFCLGSLILLFGTAFGLWSLRAKVEVENLFRSDSPVLVSLRKLEEQLGPLDQTELLIIFPKVGQEGFDSRVQLVKHVQEAVASIPNVKLTHSLINYLPNEPEANDIRSFAVRSAYRNSLRRERENLANERNLVMEGDREIWRISLRFPFTSEYDWAALGEEVKSRAQAALTQFNADANEVQVAIEANLVYTGRANLFQEAQQNLLRDLFRNFALAFVVITPMLIIALRSVVIGLLAMLPNLFPAVVLFGSLGFVDYPVDLAIAMTACIALGIAVDDTTHLLVRFRNVGGTLRNAKLPIKKTMGHCGPAMTHTTLIACGGLLVYALGEMQVVARFSVTISLLLFLGLIADLVMMPAILLCFELVLNPKSRQRKLES